MAPRSSTLTAAEGVYLVEIGPVAGGLNALFAVIASLRPRDGISYLISTGSLRDKGAAVARLIARMASMPVVPVRNGIRVQAKCIYISPPQTRVRVERKRIWLTPHLDPAAQRAASPPQRQTPKNGLAEGLPDQALLHQRLQQACKQYRRNKRRISLLLVEPSFPPGAAKNGALKEAILTALARRLEFRIRNADIVARAGDSSLGILLRDFFLREEVKDVAERLIHSFAEPLRVGGENILLQANIGIAVHPDNSRTADGLLRAAEQSLLTAKQSGGNTFCLLECEDSSDEERLWFGQQLQVSLDSGHLAPVFQPIIDLPSGRVAGAEALLRLSNQSPLEAPVSRIVEIAEKSGAIHLLGERILSQVCRQIRKWDAAGMPPIDVAVNLSAIQLGVEGAAQGILRLLQKYAVAPARLHVEITESVLLERSELVRRQLSELHKAGVSLVLDDFGTGYCSLTYLRQFPVRCLKLDLSFVHGVGTGSNDEEIIAAMIGLAHALGMRVVAEGAETEQQVAFLRRQHCDMAQGYYFGRPMTAEELAEFIQQNPTARLKGCEAAVCDA